MSNLEDALDHMRRAKITPEQFIAKVRDPNYDYKKAEIWKALKALQAAAHPPSPPPAVPPFGRAGQFSGRGIMLGSNRDVWQQALTIAKDNCLEVVAFTVGIPSFAAEFTKLGVRVVEWAPPERMPTPATCIFQAENEIEWAQIRPELALAPRPRAVVLNNWAYGQFPLDTVALVEAYYNEGWGVNFEEFKNYMPAGAIGTIPVCGGYSASGRSDAASAALYQQLATWSGGPFPGFWMFAGESYLTPESVQVLKGWKP